MQLPPLSRLQSFRCTGRCGWMLQQSSPWFQTPTSVTLLCPRWTQSEWPICWSCCSPTISQYVPSLVFEFLIQPLPLPVQSELNTYLILWDYFPLSQICISLLQSVLKHWELSIQSPGTMAAPQRNINTQLFNQNKAIARLHITIPLYLFPTAPFHISLVGFHPHQEILVLGSWPYWRSKPNSPLPTFKCLKDQ